MRIHTHYDNLKVARDAPHAVIRAAYKTLTQQYHPDRNPGDDEAAKIMSLINQAYDVLSHPEKRRQHDAWIREVEMKEAGENTHSGTRSSPASSSSNAASTERQAATSKPSTNQKKNQKLSYRLGRLLLAHAS